MHAIVVAKQSQVRNRRGRRQVSSLASDENVTHTARAGIEGCTQLSSQNKSMCEIGGVRQASSLASTVVKSRRGLVEVYRVSNVRGRSEFSVKTARRIPGGSDVIPLRTTHTSQSSKPIRRRKGEAYAKRFRERNSRPSLCGNRVKDSVSLTLSLTPTRRT